MGEDNETEMSPQDAKNAEVMGAINDLGVIIMTCRPDDRSELDHAYSTLFTDWKKLRAWAASEIFMPFEPLKPYVG